MEVNAGRLKFLSLDLEKKSNVIIDISSIDMSFILNNMVKVERHTIVRII